MSTSKQKDDSSLTDSSPCHPSCIAAKGPTERCRCRCHGMTHGGQKPQDLLPFEPQSDFKSTDPNAVGIGYLKADLSQI